MTSGGQTPYPISTIFNRLPKGTMDNIYMENEEAASKTVGAGPRTDRQTHRQTDRQTDTHTDMTVFMIVAHPQMGNYNQN